MCDGVSTAACGTINQDLSRGVLGKASPTIKQKTLQDAHREAEELAERKMAIENRGMLKQAERKLIGGDVLRIYSGVRNH